MANTTRHTDIKKGPGGRFECAHFIIPRYATAPAKPKDGEMWYDVSNNEVKIYMEGTTKTISTS